MFVRALFAVLLAAVVQLTTVGSVTHAAALPDFGTDLVRVTEPPFPGEPLGSRVSSVRVGHHDGFDRVVFTIEGGLMGYQVQYVPEVTQDASGEPIPLEGTAFVHVALQGTTNFSSVQDTTTPRFPMLRQVKGAGDWEGVTSYGVGLADRLGFRVFTLTAPNRVVVDFATPPGSDSDPEVASGQPVTEPVPAAERSAVDQPVADRDGSTPQTSAARDRSARLLGSGLAIAVTAGAAATLLLGGLLLARSLRRRIT